MNNLKKLSYQEFIIGFLVPIPLIPILDWWILLIAPLSSLLWALGGTYYKPLRRLGIPLSLYITISNLTKYNWWYLISIPLGIAILSLGDGFPDYHPLTKDNGSYLGSLVVKYIDRNPQSGGLLTKLLIPILFQLSLIPYYIK